VLKGLVLSHIVLIMHAQLGIIVKIQSGMNVLKELTMQFWLPKTFHGVYLYLKDSSQM
jgi:hypothetical protein